MHMLTTFILLFILVFAAWQDVRNYRIKNTLVISGALLGILLHTLLPMGIGFYEAILGWVMGFLLLLPLYLLRVMGAGDVKLMAMVGAFLGVQATIVVLLYALLAGGVLSIVVAWFRGSLYQSFVSMKILITRFIRSFFVHKSSGATSFASVFNAKDRLSDASARIPYGVAIMMGTIIYIVTYSFNFVEL